MGLLSPLADCDAKAVGDTRGLSKGATFLRDWGVVFISRVILGLVSRGDGQSGVEKVKLPCRIISRTSSGVNFGLESSNGSSTSSEWGLMDLLIVRRCDDEGLFDDRVRCFDDTGLFDNRDRLVNSRSGLPEGGGSTFGLADRESDSRSRLPEGE
jgi:hypothetical protein